MVFNCCVPYCKGNYRTGPKVSIYSFPKEETLRKRWIAAIQRKNFQPSKSSRVCHLHFEPSEIVREASGYDPRTGRTLTAPLYIPRLRKDAVPTLCLPPPGTLVKKVANNRRENQPKKEPVKGGTEKADESQLAKSLQTVLETESENIAEMSIAIKQEPIESIDEAPQLVIGKILNAEQVISSSCISSTSSSHSSSSSSAISTPPSSSSSSSKSSPAISTPSSSSSSSSISTPPSSSTLPAIGTPPSSSSSSTINSLSSSSSSSTINLLSSRSSSAISSPLSSSLSSAISKLPFPLNASPITNHDSTNMNKTPGRLVSNKQAKKRKANDAEPDARCATQAKLCHRTKPSMPSKKNGKLRPPAGTSKKSAGRSNLQSENDENATKEMFQSLFNGSENSPLCGPSTSKRPEDLFDVFAAFVADKLREMDWDDCAYALRAILDVVFKTGKAKRAGKAKIGVSTSGSSSRSSDQE